MATGAHGRLLEGLDRCILPRYNSGAIMKDDPSPLRCGHGGLAARQHGPLTRDVNDGLALGGHERGALHTNVGSVTGDDLVSAGDQE